MQGQGQVISSFKVDTFFMKHLVRIILVAEKNV